MSLSTLYLTAERKTGSVHIEPVHTGLGTSSCTFVKRVFLETVNKIYGETKNGIILLIQLLNANLFLKKITYLIPLEHR